MQFVKKLESKGFQELKFTEGRRYIVRANNSAGRGIAAPSTIHLDEAREYREEEVWSALRYTQMASPNPQAWIYSNMGDKSSIILNKLRDRAIAATMGVKDDIGWFEWSADPAIKFDNSPEFWFGVAQANPSLGHTINQRNIEAVLSDPEDIVRTEVLCIQVDTINPVVNASLWEQCRIDDSTGSVR